METSERTTIIGVFAEALQNKVSFHASLLFFLIYETFAIFGN